MQINEKKSCNVRQHVDAKMSVKKCDTEIKKKKIYVDGNKCKAVNTFILSDYKQVKAICNGQGRYDQTNKTKSKAKFRIVRCELKNNGARKPNCRYKGTLLTNRTVVVRCEGKLPVHYYDDEMTFESNNATIGKIPMHSTSVPTNIHF
uniref:Ribonuclease A-domain domain-containing protein n=1 Tax=Oreochromis niloticus TaxID=8128 RepID=A0A669CZY1_ORENI